MLMLLRTEANAEVRNSEVSVELQSSDAMSNQKFKQ
jgi:hypothetical protein